MRFLKYFAVGAAVLIAVAIVVPSLLRRDILDPPPGTPPINCMRVLNMALNEYRGLYGQFPRSLAELGPASSGSGEIRFQRDRPATSSSDQLR